MREKVDVENSGTFQEPCGIIYGEEQRIRPEIVGANPCVRPESALYPWVKWSAGQTHGSAPTGCMFIYLNLVVVS